MFIGFSSSGDYAYISIGRRNHQIILQDIEVSLTSQRYIARCLAVDGTFYKLVHSTNNSSSLSSAKAEPTRRDVATKRVWLDNLVQFLPSNGNNCRLFLILGKTDNEYMHALMVPYDHGAPELKTIPLTWAEARAILDRKWEDKYGSAELGQD